MRVCEIVYDMQGRGVNAKSNDTAKEETINRYKKAPSDKTGKRTTRPHYTTMSDPKKGAFLPRTESTTSKGYAGTRQRRFLTSSPKYLRILAQLLAHPPTHRPHSLWQSRECSTPVERNIRGTGGGRAIEFRACASASEVGSVRLYRRSRRKGNLVKCGCSMRGKCGRSEMQ